MKTQPTLISFLVVTALLLVGVRSVFADVSTRISTPSTILECNYHNLCYTIQPGDTLWALSQKYLGSGFRWRELTRYVSVNDRDGAFVNPRRLQSGERVYLKASSMIPAGNGRLEGVAVSPFNNDVALNFNTYGSNAKTIFLNGAFYDGGYRNVSHMRFSPKGTRFAYEAQSGSTCWFVVDKVKNEMTACANDIQIPVYNDSETHYAVRVDAMNQQHWTDPDQFMVLSDIGNGPYYDYVDSVMWSQDDVLIYRAQVGDQWRVVINHQDQEIFDYIDDLKIEKEKIMYRARHVDGSWTDEVIE